MDVFKMWLEQTDKELDVESEGRQGLKYLLDIVMSM